MKFVHYVIDVGDGQSIVVNISHAANVQVMDDVNLSRYRRGQSFKYFGGYADRSPVVLRPPRSGRWNVAIDLGGASGSLRWGVAVQ